MYRYLKICFCKIYVSLSCIIRRKVHALYNWNDNALVFFHVHGLIYCARTVSYSKLKFLNYMYMTSHETLYIFFSMGICYILRCLVIYYEAWYAFKFKKKKTVLSRNIWYQIFQMFAIMRNKNLSNKHIIWIVLVQTQPFSFVLLS